MLHARDDLLADIAALVEIDAGKTVHVGLVRERIAVHEIEPAARHAERDAMGLVFGGIDQLGADEIGQLLLEIFGDQDASSRARIIARIGERKVRLRRELAVPGREHAEMSRGFPP